MIPDVREPGHATLEAPVAVLSLILVVDQILLWAFLGLVTPIAAAIAIGLIAVAGVVLLRRTPLPGLRRLAICTLVTATIFLLGGEGRLFYAHPDWQVRSAVLRDLTLNPWPFVYVVPDGPDLLRAPLGMYLAPAVVGKWLGYHAAEWALFARNTALFATLLVLGSRLFATPRSRGIALVVFVAFSGMDLIAQLMAEQPLLASSERWNVAIFSAHVTQAFAVPQHALAGWIGALLFLLWRRGKLPLAGFLAPIPLLALWSPFAVMGIAPYAALAGITTLLRRDLRGRDVILPALTLALAVPSLLYLTAGSGAVGGGGAGITLAQYAVFEAIEVGPYLLALAFVGGRLGGSTLAVTAGVLLAAPLIRIGESNDFVMRASIPALAILAVSVADALARPVERRWRILLTGAFAIGLATPLFEVVRALVYPASPEMRCGFFGVVPGGYDTYVAPLARINPLVAPERPTRVMPHEPARCWSTPWPNPLYREFPDRVAPEDRDERL